MPKKEIELSLDLPGAPDIEVIEEKRPAPPLSQNLPQAPDMETVERKGPDPVLSQNLPTAPDIDTFTEEFRTIISPNIPVSADKQVIAQILPPPLLSLDLAPAPSVEVKNVFIPFDGEWIPDSDPIEIGARNYKTLQNYRYAGDKIVHLESVLGYTKINTTALTTYTNIRNGYQLRSEYVPSITSATTIVFVDGAGGADSITDSGSRFVAYGFKLGMTISVSGSTSNDGEYTIAILAAGRLTLITGVLTAEGASATVTITGIPKSYVLVHAEHSSAPAQNESLVYQNQTGIPKQGDFESTVLHTDSAVQLEGRFSDAPNSQVAYCNAEESCIWAGEEMRCAGFFTFFSPKIVGSTDISFVDGAGGADTITDTGNGFLDAGFKAGHQITVAVTGLEKVSVAVFDGSGLDDLTSGGTFSGSAVTDYVVEIDASVPSPDTFRWSDDGGATWDVENVGITGSAQTLNNGVTVTFGAIDGHTVGESWSFDAPANAGDYNIVSVVAGTITLATALLTGETNKSAVIGVSIKKDHIKATDYTDAINNEINSAVEAASVDGNTVGNYGIVLSTRPLKGIKFYIRTANGSTSTTSWKVWTGEAFEAVTTYVDGTRPAAISMAQTGTFTFDSTVSTAKPMHFEGLYLYAYLFELSAGTADIYHVTLDAPFQAMVDVWDGVYRQPIQFHTARGLTTDSSPVAGSDKIVIVFKSNRERYKCYQVPYADYQKIEVGAEIVANAVTATVVEKIYSSSFLSGIYYYAGSTGIGQLLLDTDLGVRYYGATYTYANPVDAGGTADYKDYTLEVNEPSFADYPIGAVIDGLTAQHHILMGFEERMSAIWIEMIANLVNVASAKISAISYWKGDGYDSVGILTDSTQGLPGNSGANKSFNRSGLVSWHPPDKEDEFRKTLFGVNAYYYLINVDTTLTGTEGGAAEVVIDTIKGIPAQKTIKPFKFPVSYKNRLMLCGFTKGKEGNRIDYSVKDAPDVFNGDESSMDGIQSLYIGGREDLTGAIEIFNRFGSSIISSLLLFKDTETYLLTGDGPDNYRIYTISKTIGCPAPLTLAAAETGYTFAEEINRNIVAWMSYSGPMIFDGSAIVPIPGVKKYFDPAKTARLETASVERARGWYNNSYKEYNLVLPSASGATNCNVWIVYDLVRKRWFEKEPGSSEIPQAAWSVYDTDGTQYIYCGIDDGNVMRLENGALWSDDSATPMAPIIETGDFFPAGDVWLKTRLRRFKAAIKKISESDRNFAINHYADTGTSTTALTDVNSDAGNPITRETQACNLLGWAHRFKFAIDTGFSSETQFQPIGWGFAFFVERDDEQLQ